MKEGIKVLENREEENILNRQNTKNVHEAMAWIRKYFKEDSLDKIFFLLVIKGINDSIFISKPIQVPSQFEEEIEIVDLKSIISRKRRFKLFKMNKVYIVYYITVYWHKRFWFFRYI